MPLRFEKQITPAKKLAVWEIKEELGYFVDKLQIQEIPGRNIQRQLEQAACSHLLNLLSGEQLHSRLLRDEFGKPRIVDSKISVSFSHSKQMIACMVDLEGEATGIDIEYKRNNIGLLAHKFVSERDESPLTGMEHMQLIWGAKEVLYKIYGRKGLDFKRDLYIQSGDLLIGNILRNESSMLYRLEYCSIENFILVWNV